MPELFLKGPDALRLLERLGINIAGHEVLVLRHGLAGHLGAELSGPYDEMASVRSALLDIGKKHGLVPGGTKTYFSTIISARHYHNDDRPLNKEFVKACNAEFKRNPDFSSVGGWDGMHVVYERRGCGASRPIVYGVPRSPRPARLEFSACLVSCPLVVARSSRRAGAVRAPARRAAPIAPPAIAARR